jgi:hypothetical protein
MAHRDYYFGGFSSGSGYPLLGWAHLYLAGRRNYFPDYLVGAERKNWTLIPYIGTQEKIN